MDTCYASPEKAEKEKLDTEINILSSNPLMSGLLESVCGLLAVVNEHRQIVAINDDFLHLIGVEDPGTALGLRLGEAVQCIHAHDEPAGCGTTRYCATCGAAIAMITSLEKNVTVERICALSTDKGVNTEDIALLIKSHPIRIDGQRFLLLFMQDITLQERRAALERTFFHDVNNMLNMLVQATELLMLDNPSTLAERIVGAASRLHQEVAIQRSLTETSSHTYQPVWRDISPEALFEQLEAFFENHPAKNQKQIVFSKSVTQMAIKTDISVLLRILSNMIINALEATPSHGTIKVWTEEKDGQLIFCVWNRQAISREVAHRIFQRNFSTKAQSGRGIGTYSMKLFGENILGGKVDFRTSKAEGTVFRFTHIV